MSDERQTWEASARNREPILAVLRKVLPPAGTVLEIASGTGQHAVHFAPALAPRIWQPSEPDPKLRASIAAWIDAAPSEWLRPPLALDVMEEPWPVEKQPCDPALAAIVNINMIHIAPWAACVSLLAAAGRLLPAGGVLFLYGPYKVDGQWRTANDPAFDESLRRRNPAWGLRNLEDVIAEAATSALQPDPVIDMPAGNLSVVFRKR
ncbi:DUF938 domain-containing protein [Emcibacter sp. SYSU 3D8]|uniref:DUF938 domain-containing protein n=1 Tax=Emcibacter sp. SYSU 3D8 TaxID=3133969 RepID=UPI0031FF4164